MLGSGPSHYGIHRHFFDGVFISLFVGCDRHHPHNFIRRVIRARQHFRDLILRWNFYRHSVSPSVLDEHPLIVFHGVLFQQPRPLRLFCYSGVLLLAGQRLDKSIDHFPHQGLAGYWIIAFDVTVQHFLGYPSDRIWRVRVAKKHPVIPGIPRYVIRKLGRHNCTCWNPMNMFQRSSKFGDTRRAAVSSSDTDNGSIALFPDFRP